MENASRPDQQEPPAADGGGDSLDPTPAQPPAIRVLRRISRWGATDEEATRPLPGDDAVPDPRIASTRAITIHAPMHVVWPWLVQMGWKRAGWYSYDMIDNDRTPSAERIIPSLQTLQVGDFVPEGAEVGWTVRALEPGHQLLLETHEPMKGVDWVQQRDSSWLFLLTGIGAEHTRLVERARTTLTMNRATLVGRLLATQLSTLLLAPGDFVMARRQMLGIKRRAERDWVLRGESRELRTDTVARGKRDAPAVRRVVLGATAAGGAAAVYVVVRRWHLRWVRRRAHRRLSAERLI